MNTQETKRTRTAFIPGTHLLVIDDDPTFRLLLSAAAKECGLKVTACSSIEDLKAQELPYAFDVVVLDYYLDDFKNLIKGTDIAGALGAIPVILVSANEECIENAEIWPSSIRKFIHKKAGVSSIARVALELSHVL